MYFAQSDNERVQTSGVSDKAGRIAIGYKDKMKRINREWQDHLVKKHAILADELIFFKSAILLLMVYYRTLFRTW